MKTRLPSSSYVGLAPRPDTRQGILTRRTFRTFERRPVPPALRRDVLAAARWAPTAGDAEFVRHVVTHWIEEKVKVLIDCPREWDLVGVMPLGVAAETPERSRAPLTEVVYQDRFGTPWRPGADTSQGG